MSKLLIICIESPINKSDYMYINTVLNNIYVIDSDVKLHPLALNGKDNYNKPNTIIKLNKIKKVSPHNEKHIIYCLDYDEFNTEDLNKNEEIENFCKNNGYELVWFRRTIEEVFLKTKVPNSEKMRKATMFIHHIKTNHIEEDRLKESRQKIKTSNFLCVFDKFLQRK